MIELVIAQVADVFLIGITRQIIGNNQAILLWIDELQCQQSQQVVVADACSCEEDIYFADFGEVSPVLGLIRRICTKDQRFFRMIKAQGCVGDQVTCVRVIVLRSRRNLMWFSECINEDAFLNAQFAKIEIRLFFEKIER